MPKSKKRKAKHNPRRKPVQQSLAGPVQSANRTSIPAQSTVLTEPSTVPIKGRINRTVRTQVIPQISNVATELKVIGVITVILLAIIVVLYFIFR